jgi:hypothetical protein
MRASLFASAQERVSGRLAADRLGADLAVRLGDGRAGPAPVADERVEIGAVAALRSRLAVLEPVDRAVREVDDLRVGADIRSDGDVDALRPELLGCCDRQVVLCPLKAIHVSLPSSQ